MSQLQYYGETPAIPLPHKSGLFAWGVVMIVFGGLSGLMAVFALLGAVVIAMGTIPNTTGQNPVVIFLGVGVYVVLAVVLISLGIGSLKGRRWVRPIMMVVTVLSMVSCLAALPTFIEGTIRSVGKPSSNPAAAGLGTNFEAGTLACSGFFMLVLGEILPMVLFWFYGRSSVQATLDQLDPKPRWTDRCSIPVLGWAAYCILLSLGMTFVIFKGAFPFFSVVLVDIAGRLVPIALGATLCIGGILCYRHSRIGWAMTMAAILLLAASYTTFSFLGDKAFLVDQMTQGMPANTKEMTSRMSSTVTIAPAIIYALAVIYGVWVSKRMDASTASPAFPTSS